MLFTLDNILNDIEGHLKKKRKFSIVRIGDGDLKLLDELNKGKVNPEKFKRSGIPFKRKDWVRNMYRNACNAANYTSSFEMYYINKFWGRKFSPGTKDKVINWKAIYEKAGITNLNHCNPEIGYLIFLEEHRNLMNLLQGKRVCLITCFPRAAKVIKKNGAKEVKTIIIPPIHRGHYDKYGEITKEIVSCIDQFDIFLVGAGALGKGYSLTIKNHGGISIDIGQVMNTWAGKEIAGRFRHVLRRSKKNGLFKLTPRAEKFREFL